MPQDWQAPFRVLREQFIAAARENFRVKLALASFPDDGAYSAWYDRTIQTDLFREVTNPMNLEPGHQDRRETRYTCELAPGEFSDPRPPEWRTLRELKTAIVGMRRLVAPHVVGRKAGLVLPTQDLTVFDTIAVRVYGVAQSLAIPLPPVATPNAARPHAHGPVALPIHVPQVLTEIQAGGGLSLSAAGGLFPGHRGNGTVDPSTVFRWVTRGTRTPDCRAVKLEAVRVGGRWLTSRSALARFVGALTAATDPPPPTSPPTLPTASARRKAAERAAQQLEDMGA